MVKMDGAGVMAMVHSRGPRRRLLPNQPFMADGLDEDYDVDSDLDDHPSPHTHRQPQAATAMHSSSSRFCEFFHRGKGDC